MQSGFEYGFMKVNFIALITNTKIKKYTKQKTQA